MIFVSVKLASFLFSFWYKNRGWGEVLKPHVSEENLHSGFNCGFTLIFFPWYSVSGSSPQLYCRRYCCIQGQLNSFVKLWSGTGGGDIHFDAILVFFLSGDSFAVITLNVQELWLQWINHCPYFSHDWHWTGIVFPPRLTYLTGRQIIRVTTCRFSPPLVERWAINLHTTKF